MKKFSTICGALLLVVMITVFTACQKEQSTTTVSQENASSAPSDETRVVGVAGSAGEVVSGSYAAALQSNYYRKFSDDDNKSQYVAFDAETLIKFITKLKVSGSTKIYVNFGVYGKGAPAPNRKDDGKLTVFFTGSKIPAPSYRYRSDGFLDALLLDGEDFLNHGEMFP